MATIEDLFAALKAADRAGDVEDATRLAQYISSLGYGPKIQPEPPPKKIGVSDYLKDIPKAVGRGAVGLLETAGIGAAAALPDEYEQAARAGIAGIAEPAKQYLAPATPEIGESISSKLLSGVGSTLPFFTLGPLGLAGRAAAAGLGVGAGAGEARVGAEQAGATAEERAKATALGAPTGLLDIIAPNIGPLKSLLTTALARGGVEGLTEAAQKVSQNMIAKGIYNPEQDVLAGSAEEGAYGAGVGALTSLLVDLALGRRAKGTTTPPPSEKAPPIAEAAPPVAEVAPPTATLPEIPPVAAPPQPFSVEEENRRAEELYRQEEERQQAAEQKRLDDEARVEAEKIAQQERVAAMPGFTRMDDNVVIGQVMQERRRAEEERAQAEAVAAEQKKQQEALAAEQERLRRMDEIRNTTYSQVPSVNARMRQQLLDELKVPEQEPADLFPKGEPVEKEPVTPPKKITRAKFSPEDQEQITSLKAEIADATKEITAAKKEKGNLFKVLEGKLIDQPGAINLSDIDPDNKKLKKLYNPQGTGVLLEDMVEDGKLDDFLPAGNRKLIGEQENPRFDSQAAIEHIANKLRTGDYTSELEAANIVTAERRRDEAQQKLDKLQSLPEIEAELETVARRRPAVSPVEAEDLIKPTVSEPVGIETMMQQARDAGVDVERVQEDVARQMPEATQAQYNGALYNTLSAAVSESAAYTIDGRNYTRSEIETLIGERFTEDEINDLIAQAEAKQKPTPKPPAPPKTGGETIAPPGGEATTRVAEKVTIPGASKTNTDLSVAIEDNDWNRVTDALSKSANPIISNVGRMAKDLVGVTTQVNPAIFVNKRKNWMAFYRQGEGSIYVKNKSNAANEWVVAHETVHALTTDAIAHPTAAQRPAVNRLKNLYRFVKTKLGARGRQMYGLKNLDEFIAEGNSNPEFQQELSKIKYQNKTAWGAFTQNIANLLGIKNESALTELMALTEELTSAESQTGKVAKDKGVVASTIPQGLEESGFTRLPKDSPRRYRQGSNNYGTWEKDGVRVSLSSNVLAYERGTVQKYMADDDEMTIEALLVDPDKRGKGLAKEALELVTKLADGQGKTLYLEPVQLEKGAGLNERQLQDLYSRYGFKKTSPSGKVMVREPAGTRDLALFGPKEKAPTPTRVGADALEMLDGIGRSEAKPEPGYAEKVRQSWDNARDNPEATREAAYGAFRKFADKVETMAFSSDAALNNQIRREVMNSMVGNEQKIGMLLNTSLSQTAHSDAIANLFLMEGNIKYDEKLHKWVGVKDNNNIFSLSKKLDEIASEHGLNKEQIERIAHTAFEARRTQELNDFNDMIDEQVKDMRAEAASMRASGKPVAANALSEKAQNLLAKKKSTKNMNPEQIQTGMKFFEMFPKLSEVADTWNGIRQNALNVMVDTGLYTQGEAEMLMDAAGYVPFYREEQIEEGKGPKEFLRSLSVQADKRLKGSEKPVNDIFDNMVRWTQYAINRGVRNRSAVALATTAADLKLADRVKDAKSGDNVIRVWQDGEQTFYNMQDPLFMAAFQGLESVSIPTVKFFSKMANVLRQSVVMYPLFSIAQIPQDSFAAMFTSGLKPQHALTIPVRAVKEFIQTLRGKSKAHEELKNIGAVGVRDFTSSVIRADAEILSGLKDKSFWGEVKRRLNNFAMAADNAVRQATFEAAEAQGLSKEEAYEKVFEIFNVRRRGTSKGLALAGQVIPFFNAYLAAQHVAYRTLTGVGTSPTERKAAYQTLAATTGSVMALSLLYAMMNGDDEDYLNKPTPTRDRLLMIPGTGGFSIPLRADIFALPKVLAEHTYLLLTNNGYEDGAKFRSSIVSLLANSFLSPTAVPQAIKPLIEVGINYDFFQEKPLVGVFEQKKDLDRQFQDSTSEFSKALAKVPVMYNFSKGEWEGLSSPIGLDHMIRGMFGSFGGLFLYMTNPILADMAGKPRPSMTMQDALATIPNASGFVSKEYETALRKDFYALKDVTDRAASTLSDLKQRSPQDIADYLSDETIRKRVGMAPMVNKLATQLTDIRKAVTNISQAPEDRMDEDEKQRQIKKLREAERQLLQNANLKRLREMANM